MSEELPPKGIGVIEVLADAPLVRLLAEDIMDGEIDMSMPHMFPTDKMAYDELCKEVREEYGVGQSDIEQAVAMAVDRRALELGYRPPGILGLDG